MHLFLVSRFFFGYVVPLEEPREYVKSNHNIRAKATQEVVRLLLEICTRDMTYKQQRLDVVHRRQAVKIEEAF